MDQRGRDTSIVSFMTASGYQHLTDFSSMPQQCIASMFGFGSIDAFWRPPPERQLETTGASGETPRLVLSFVRITEIRANSEQSENHGSEEIL